MRFSVSSRLEYEVQTPAVFILNIEAAALRNQRILSESLRLTPAVGARPPRGCRAAARGSCGRPCRPALSKSPMTATIELDMHDADPATVPEMAVAALPLEVMPYLNPSRYCQSDLLARFAQREFGCLSPGHGRVTQMCNWINEHVDYVRGSSDAQTSAYDTMVLRAESAATLPISA